MRGARLVVAHETERNRRWAESKIKVMTGPKITCRFMRQNFFTYKTQFKVVIAGNHKPSLRGVDEAIRRRLHLVPFTVTIPPDERDRQLAEKLQPEWPGILHWAVQGCLEWQRVGLAPPPAVRDASAAYFTEEDLLGRWIEECCAVDPTSSQLVGELFANWKGWTDAARERAGSQKAFSQNLEKRDFVQARQGGTGKSIFHGIALKP
jgi:putative DNA primase/helicase